MRKNKIGSLVLALAVTLGAVCNVGAIETPNNLTANATFSEANWLDGVLYGSESFKSKIQSLQYEEALPEGSVYVSATGSDTTGDGSINTPYSTINHALSTIGAGGTVVVRGGTYNERILFTNSGTEDNYITLKNYPGEVPILDNTGASLDDGTQVDFGGQSCIRFEGFEVCNNKTTWAYAIYLGNAEKNIIIRNNSIHDVKANKPSSSSSSGANAIILYGENKEPISNVLIQGNKVYDNDTGWCEAISTASNCENINVIGNTILNNTNIGIDFCGNFGYCSDASLDQPRYCVARGNVVSNCNSSYATSYGLYIDGARDCLLENNISYNNQGGIEIGSEEKKTATPVKNNIIRNNLVYGNTENGITVGGYSKKVGVVYDTKIYNNTIVNNSDDWNGQLHIAMVDGLEVKNNIMYTDKTWYSMVTAEFESSYCKNMSFENNLYYSGNPYSSALFIMYNQDVEGFDNWKSYEPSAVYENPLFNNLTSCDFTLSALSPAIDTGSSGIEYGNVDLLQNTRVNNVIDKGCYEYISATQTTTEPTTVATTETTTEQTTVATTETSTEQTTVATTETSTETTTESSLVEIIDIMYGQDHAPTFVLSVNSLQFKEVGFIFEVNGKIAERGSNTVYTSLGSEGSHLGDGYLYAFEVTDIPINDNVLVTPYVITLSGEKVLGKTKSEK